MKGKEEREELAIIAIALDSWFCPLQEAVRLLLTGKSLLTPSDEMTDYNYSGTKQWSARERQQFRRAWRVHRKQFHLLRSMVREPM